MEEQPDVEILIHIGAPSKAVDDARNRSLAASYLAFEPAKSVPFYPQGNSDNSIKDGGHVLATDEEEDSIIPLDDRIGYFQSPQASFRSVVDNADSPRVRVCGVPDHPFLQQTPASATQALWEMPASIVQDSHPMNHAEFASLTSPTRVLENYLQHFESSPNSSKQHSQSNTSDTPCRHSSQCHGRRISPRKLVSHAQQTIPCTPHVKNITELPSNRREESKYQQSNNSQRQLKEAVIDESDDNVIEETVLLSSSQPSELLRADSEPPPKLRRSNLVASPYALARAASDIGPQPLPRDYKTPVTIKFLSSHGFTYDSLEIRPPEPPTSESHIGPHDLITQGLRKLGDDVGLPSRFRPKEQTRDLIPYERGHWLLDCSSWEPRLKREAWAFLANYIGTEIAGWGVWCKRDPDFKELRAYCWGSVVAHIYYVLWLSSHREIVFTGSSWIDAEGAKVIVMGSRDRPKR
ncbi:hypothetical protein F4803DRAFT_498118 [Xylaria telfairii]|nr:hypothetical protein F4803DRAFT_498118 [Xylaria telfairii]